MRKLIQRFVSGAALVVIMAGCQARRSFDGRVLLEQNVPMQPAGEYAGKAPLQFEPLPCECLGVADEQGRFVPILYLSGSVPRGGGQTISLNPRDTLKVYRGTNQLVAKNHWLGEFNVSDFQGTGHRPVSLEVDFEITAEREVLLSAKPDPQSSVYLKLDRVEVAQK